MFSSLPSKIGIAGICVAGGLLISLPAHAAVPVAVTQFDAGTDFEQSILTFLGELLDLLGQKQMESTAAFELLKIEKAREDTNKLFQEVLEELADYGIVLVYPDPRLQTNLGCIADPARCDAYATNEAQLTIVPYKDSRIIHNVFDYIYEEPRQQARVFAQCFFNLYVWHQAGYTNEIEGELQISVPNKTLACHKTTRGELCTYGRSTDQSINNIRARRDAVLGALRRSNQYMVDYPQIFLFGDWAGYPEADRYGLSGRGESYNKELRRQSMKNCALVLGTSNTVPPGIPDPLYRFQNIPAGAITETFSKILPTLGKTTSGRTNNSWYDLSIVREGRNNLDGITGMAIAEIERIISETQNERELTYLAGQGIRPERLYARIEGTDPDYPGLGKIESLRPPSLIYEHDTGYIVSPAVVLLQKMQAANQAMFDLAQKAFLYLDAEDVSIQTQRRYGVWSNAENCFNDEGEVVACPSLFGVFERQICNTAAPDPDADPPVEQTCLMVRPWLKPNVGFLSAPDQKHIGPGRKSSKFGPAPIISATGGLPAPWEDTNITLSLGNEKVGGTRGYMVADYRWPAGALAGFPPGSGQGDNIGSKVLGADFAINDWYDRVFEMYEPNRNTGIRSAFTLSDWSCYLATWFSFAGVQTFPSTPPTPSIDVFYTPRTAPTQSLRDIASDPQKRDSFLPAEFETSLSQVSVSFVGRDGREEVIKKYCAHRIADRSY